MVMGRRFAAWRIAPDLGNHSLYLRCSGWRARRRLSPPPNSAQARAKPLVLLPPIRAQRSTFALLSSLFYPHVANVSSAQERATLRLLKGDGNIGGIVHSDALS